MYGNAIKDYCEGGPNDPFWWCESEFYNYLPENENLIWNSPLRTNPNWRFDSPPSQHVLISSQGDSCGICSINLQVFTSDLTWDNTIWQPYDWVAGVCTPRTNSNLFNPGAPGIAFFSLLNANGDNIESSWFGTVTLNPQNGGQKASNISSDYKADLTVKAADIFDELPEVFMDFESLQF